MNINSILLKPRITEKALSLVKKDVYSFEIATRATKTDVKKAVESLFKVTVDHIKIVTKKGKVRRVGKTMKTKRLPNKKVALVALKEGKISIFPTT